MFVFLTELINFAAKSNTNMTPNEQLLSAFETRVRQMILRFTELKKENVELYEMLSENENKLKELQTQISQQADEQERLRMAKMLAVTDGGLQQAKDRLAALVREVNKCIALLKEAQ